MQGLTARSLVQLRIDEVSSSKVLGGRATAVAAEGDFDSPLRSGSFVQASSEATYP